MATRTLIAVLTLIALLAPTSSASAHAELESANPAPGSSVEDAPLTLELTFTEEVATDGIDVHVVTPDDEDVHAGDAEVDLNDPSRRRVTVSLQANLPPATYTVYWRTRSAIDDDETTGAYTLTVTGEPVPPTPTLAPGATPALPEPMLPRDANGNPLGTEDEDFDGRAFGLSIGAGLIGVAVLAFFWRAVRPSNPVFGGRARG